MSDILKNKYKVSRLILDDIMEEVPFKSKLSRNIIALYYLLTSPDSFITGNAGNYEHWLKMPEDRDGD